MKMKRTGDGHGEVGSTHLKPESDASASVVVNLTPRESDLILHRLEVPDAIADALEEDLDAIEVACAGLSEAVQHGVLEFPLPAPLWTRVLEDCLNGSTWASSVEEDPVLYRAALRVGAALEWKLRRAGLTVRFKGA